MLQGGSFESLLLCGVYVGELFVLFCTMYLSCHPVLSVNSVSCHCFICIGMYLRLIYKSSLYCCLALDDE